MLYGAWVLLFLNAFLITNVPLHLHVIFRILLAHNILASQTRQGWVCRDQVVWNLPCPHLCRKYDCVRWVQIKSFWQEEGLKRMEASVGLALGTREEQSSIVSVLWGRGQCCLPWRFQGKGHREAQRWARGEELPVRPEKDLPPVLLGAALLIRRFSLAWTQDK